MLPAAEPVVFLAPGTRTDPYSGAPAEDWTSPLVALRACAGVEPTGSTEPLAVGRQSVVTGFRLYLDGIVEVDPSWRCDVRGVRAAVKGSPAQWAHPMTGWLAGTVVEVEVVDG